MSHISHAHIDLHTEGRAVAVCVHKALLEKETYTVIVMDGAEKDEDGKLPTHRFDVELTSGSPPNEIPDLHDIMTGLNAVLKADVKLATAYAFAVYGMICAIKFGKL